jgi:hypothetical protein
MLNLRGKTDPAQTFVSCSVACNVLRLLDVSMMCRLVVLNHVYADPVLARHRKQHAYPVSALQQLTPYKALLDELLMGQAASFVSMLLQGLRQMGGNAHIAKRIIGTLSGHAPGRVALRDACADWQAEVQRQAPEPGNKASLQWAVSRLWQLGK